MVQPYSDSVWEILGGNGKIATIGAHSVNADGNATLIAAAPELLEALRVITLDPLIASWMAQHDPKAYRQVRAAIAKATGKN